MGNRSPKNPPPPERAKSTIKIPEKQPTPKDAPSSEGKDWAIMGIGLFLGFASLGINDPWLFFICLVLSWSCFIYLGIVHSNFTHKTLFCIFGTVVFIIGAFRAYYYSQNQAQISQRDTVAQFDALGVRIGDQKREFHNQTMMLSSKLDAVRSDLLVSQKEQQNIEMMLATNTAYDPNLRERIIAAHQHVEEINSQTDDLNTWLSSYISKVRDREALAQIQREKFINEKQSQYQEFFQCYNYAINSFTNMLGIIATSKGDLLDIKGNGLPAKIDPYGPNTKIAEIKFIKTSGMNFEIDLLPSDPQLCIRGSGSTFGINSFGGGGLDIPNEPHEVIHFSLDNYKTTFDERLRILISYQVYKFSNTNQ